MIEKRFKAVAPQLLTSNGTTTGQITVADASLYKVKQTISLQNAVVGAAQFQVQRITNINTIYLGPIGSSNLIDDRSDVSAYTVALGSFIFAPEQRRTIVPEQEIERWTYEEEPVVARRVILVDKIGDKYDSLNPVPVAFAGTIDASDVRITACDDDPNPGDQHSSVRISDCDNDLKINPDGSINTMTDGGASAPLINNLAVPLANTEQSYAIPVGTKKLLIRDRAGDAKVNIAFVSGDTSLNYLTIRMGSYYQVDNINTTAGFIIYFQVNKPSRVIEVMTWS